MSLYLLLLIGCFALCEHAWLTGFVSTKLRGTSTLDRLQVASDTLQQLQNETLFCNEADRHARSALEKDTAVEKDTTLEPAPFEPTLTPTARPSTPNNLLNYTTGYLRADYIDVTTKPNVFVQAVVQTIGVCYQNRATNPPFRKLTKIVIDRASSTVTSSYADYTSAQCTGSPTYRFTEVDRFSSSVVTRNSVRVSVKLSYTTSAEQAVQVLPLGSAGFKIRYVEAFSIFTHNANNVTNPNPGPNPLLFLLRTATTAPTSCVAAQRTGC